MEFKFSSSSFIRLFTFAGLVISSIAASPLKRPECKAYQPMQGFDKSKFFTGIWYTTHLQTIFESPRDVCQKSKYQVSSDGSIQQITELYLEEIKGLINAEGPITSDFNFNDGSYNWTFSFVKDGKRVDNVFTFPVTVLDTDYDNYAIVYSCRRFANFFVIDELFVFNRKNDAEPNPKVKEVLSNIGINFDNLNSRKGVQCPEDSKF